MTTGVPERAICQAASEPASPPPTTWMGCMISFMAAHARGKARTPQLALLKGEITVRCRELRCLAGKIGYCAAALLKGSEFISCRVTQGVSIAIFRAGARRAG